MTTRKTDKRVMVYRLDVRPYGKWELWKEAKLIDETDSAFRIKGWWLMQWLPKTHFKYEIIDSTQ